jgi:ABC-type antimicrobial peptide transport system permease subunit
MVAGLGLFGMLAYAVSRRSREIGIRVAVGATVGRIAGMVCRDAAWAVAPGVLLGVAAYAACSRVVASLLYGIAPWDNPSIAGAALCLVAVCLFATFFPAIRAARIRPSQTLREE